jgi:predicted esterase
LVRDSDQAVGTLVGFHGYGQVAESLLADLERIPTADRWQLVSVQALHRFYAKDSQAIRASWMTRQDREAAIADNVEYVNRALDAVRPAETVVFLGFSQGVAMAYRAALLGRHQAAGIIALGGDVPPEFKASAPREWPRVVIGAGDKDIWYTDTKVRADEAALSAQGAEYEVIRFHGGHDWTDEFRAGVARMLQRIGNTKKP